ncbi:MAG: hypothetical protein KGS46_19270 [Chloroflexi bacterium]|nr:hypothetical protein [Chloroflexota bacterium]
MQSGGRVKLRSIIGPWSAIHWMMGHRLWQGLAGVITALLVVHFLSADEQGWYFTFVSLAALYSIFEMGLSLAVIQRVAKLCLGVRWGAHGEVAGENRGQVLALMQSGLRVYGILALVFIVCCWTVGWWMFYDAPPLSGVPLAWQLPWSALVLLTALSMITLFFWAILEGAGQLLTVYRLRLYLAVGGSVAGWIILSAGGFLWATLAIPCVSALGGLAWLYRQQKKLLISATAYHPGVLREWNQTVWPLQWRVGIYWISIFFMSQLATPILFFSQGALIAGQMGLSLTIAHMIGILAQAWIARGVPQMTQAATTLDWHRLDAIFYRNFRYSLLTFGAGIVSVVILYWAAVTWGYEARLLPWQAMVGLVLFVFFYHLHNAWAAQLRSFHKEPLAGIFLLGAALIVLGSVLVVERYSVAGIVLTMLLVQAVWIVPASWWVWRRCNQQLRR